MIVLLVRVCPDRQTQVTLTPAIQRVMKTDKPLPKDGGKFFFPALGKDLPVFNRPRAPKGSTPEIWCTASPDDIVRLRGFESEWTPMSCLACG